MDTTLRLSPPSLPLLLELLPAALLLSSSSSSSSEDSNENTFGSGLINFLAEADLFGGRTGLLTISSSLAPMSDSSSNEGEDWTGR